MLVDYERVVLGLKAKIREASINDGKRSWGERELLGALADLEIEHRVPEGQELFDDLPLPRRATQSDGAPLREPVSTGAR